MEGGRSAGSAASSSEQDMVLASVSDLDSMRRAEGAAAALEGSPASGAVPAASPKEAGNSVEELRSCAFGSATATSSDWKLSGLAVVPLVITRKQKDSGWDAESFNRERSFCLRMSRP